ncbi:hypothetical protein MXMO3_02706 [Maritalea myrionectae]|uniref:DUF4260 domain-containing protein n=1 Tax=Maritalea myrionectae TaxID=454601 RepID=A0A2R4MGP2_9HYPH|nr:DUF4260 domain-containing protein [Maritalea myrionectae]AVX05217.1 hypothetical protein MXMO3_02706 [Maritalea myrionectae]
MPSYTKYLLRLEGALVAGLALWAYTTYFGNWWLFAALILLPDLCLIVFLLNQKIGIRTYNVAHSYLVPAALAALGFVLAQNWLVLLAVIWTTHIGVDRLFGYGLKSEEDHKRTHLS